ncbi:MAG: extracellular solute-binding protein [Desulfoprunum sp.]|nr:extracellular solute-binding protein [Desulfoprunum sp.]
MNIKRLSIISCIVGCWVLISLQAALAQDSGGYRFVLAFGPWDLAEGRIDPSEQPGDPYFQYVEKTYGAAPLTISWEWEGRTGYFRGMRQYMASGQMPEAIKILDLKFGLELIEAKVLLPLDDLLPKYAPELWQTIPKDAWNIVRSMAPDRKIYYVPDLPAFHWSRAGFIRQDWLDRVGMKMPTTRDELVAVYRAFKEKDANGNGDPNDEIPVSGREGLRWCDDLFTIHGVSMYEGHPRLSWDPAKQQMISHQVSDQMKAAIKFLRYLTKEGLMDPVMPIQKKQEWVAKINANRVGHYFHTIGEMEGFTAFMERDPTARWAYLPLVRVPGVPPQKHVYVHGADPNIPVFALTTAAKDPAKILHWYNQGVATMDGFLYKSLGIPGKDWKKTGDTLVVLNKATPFYKYVPIETTQYSRDILAMSKHGEMKAPILDKMIETGFIGYDDVSLPLSVYEGYEEYMPEKATLYREYCAKMVLGVLPMSAWDEYVKAWYAGGGTKVLKRATKWYKQVNNIQ